MPLYTVIIDAGLRKLTTLHAETAGTGRSSDDKRDPLQRIWAIIQAATQLPDEQIVRDIQDVPPGQAMERARTMPCVTEVSAAP